MKFAILIVVTALFVSYTLAKKEQKKPIPEYIKKMFAENKGKREAAIAPYSYAAPQRSHSLHQSGGGSLSLGSFGVPKTLAQLGFGGHGLNFGSGHASSMQSHFPGMQAYSPSFGGSSFSGGHRGGNLPRYTSISGLFKPHAGSSGSTGYAGSAGSSGSAGAQFSEVSLSHTGPQTFGHSFSASHPQSTYAVPQFASKPSFGFSAPSFANSPSNSQFDIHSQSLPSYSSTKGLGAYASSSAPSGFSIGSQGHSSPSLAFSAPSKSYGVPSFGASHGSLNALSFSNAGNGGHSFASDGSLSSSKNAFAGFFDTGKPSVGLSGSSEISSSYGAPSSSDFKPSVYLGSSASSSSNTYSAPSSSHGALSSSHSAPLSSHSAPLSSISGSSHSKGSIGSIASQLGLSAADHEKLLSGTPIFISPKGFGHSSGIDVSSLISQGSHGGSLSSQGSHGSSLLSQGSHGGSLLSQGSHGGSLLSQGSHGGSILSQGSHGGSLFSEGSHGGSLLSEGSHGGSLLSQGSHGSPSLSGSYNFPSAGHSAPSISFAQLIGGHGAPSSNYGVPSFSHASSSDYSSLSQGISSPSFGGHGSSGGYSTEENQSEGFGHPSSSGGALISGFSTSTIHGSPNSHIPSSSYGSPSISYGAPSSGYAVPSSGYGAPSAEYGAPSSHGFSGNDFSGSSGLSFGSIGSGKLELPSLISGQSFSSSSHGFPSHGFSAPSSSYGVPHDTYGLPKGSFSHDDSQHAQSETKYNTIKYSRSLDSAPENKKMSM